MRKSVFLLAGILIVFAFCWPTPSAAQGYIELDALIVQGQIQRPQAVYIIQRAGLDFGAMAKRKSFVGKITGSIEDDPF